LKFLYSRDVHCDGKKYCTVTGAKIYGNFHKKTVQNAPFSRATIAIISLP
jgi:hypothetical protein